MTVAVDSKKVPKKTFSELEENAKIIGVDLGKEIGLKWVVEKSANSKLPKDWKEFFDDDGQIAFYHPKLKILQRTHPVLNRYKELYERLKSFVISNNRPLDQSGIKAVNSQLTALLNECLNRMNRNYPPCTPEILEAVCLLILVDTKTEFAMTNKVFSLITNYVEKNYKLSVEIEIENDVLEFVEMVREEQVKVYILNKPNDVVMCQECDVKSAKIKCEQCKDFFCKECFHDTHATGKRKNHTVNLVEQKICQICDKKTADSEVCAGTPHAKLFCEVCYVKISSESAELRKLPKKILQGLVCFECAEVDANTICEDCVDLFCSECFIKIHRRGKRANHLQLIIDRNGEVWRGGHVVPPEDSQQIIDKARSTAEGGCWLAFKDDQLNTFWYNTRDKITTIKNPYLS